MKNNIYLKQFVSQQTNLKKFNLVRYYLFLQALYKQLSEEVSLLCLILLYTCDHDETSATTAYARLEHLRSSSERQRGMSGKRSAESGLASTVSSENVFAIYDEWQRVKEIRTSYDTGDEPSVSYEYFTPQEIDANSKQSMHEFWYAITKNKVTFDSDDKTVIQTVVQVDGLGRKVRTAKTGVVNGVEGWNASGAVEYDEKARVIKEGMTEFIEGSLEDLLSPPNAPKMTKYFKIYEYDSLDRKIKTILPSTKIEKAEELPTYKVAYTIERNDTTKEYEFITRTTDPLGNISEQRENALGLVVRVSREDSSRKELTSASYDYDVLGQMLAAFDAKKNPISVEYDLLGRRTALQSLDGGRQEFFYDEASNLVRENNAVLREKHKQILYEYDGLNRLTKIDYPETKDTVYTYGRAFDKVRAANKLLIVEDASGTTSFEYGSLSEVVKETRTLHKHVDNSVVEDETSVTEYRSDYLGRMQRIGYADGEVVHYGYDAGGQLVSVTGQKSGRSFEYVTNILYDEYGQRSSISYGNGTSTEYKYDPARRWLDSILTINKYGEMYQNIAYDFDNVGNVSAYTNDCLDNRKGNYKTAQEYKYDALYQLTRTSGETTYNPYHSMNPEHVSKYEQKFAFDMAGLGNMVSKVSHEDVRPNGKTLGDGLNYSFEYVYDENFAHRLVRAGNRWYKYDSNGNVIFEKDLPEGMTLEDDSNTVSLSRVQTIRENVFAIDEGWGLFANDTPRTNGHASKRNGGRTYTWNERNQLVATVDDNRSTAYIYDYNGVRTNKYSRGTETLYFNQFYSMRFDAGVGYGNGQVVKHIYLGDTRIVTKLGSVKNSSYSEEYHKQYFYHSDHLGSASLISDFEGREYQRIEYTPYGETWVEKTSNTGMEYLPYKFTGKERDEETGLYYFGARYLDPTYSRWMSADPALGDYIPLAPIDDEAKKHNGNLPGMGGVYNAINLHLYHYSANNPLTYKDPDGRAIETGWDAFNAALDITSFVSNMMSGNYTGAAWDLASLLYDGFATAIPVLPGGTGSAKLIAKLSTEYGDDAAKLVLKYSDDMAEIIFKGGNSRKLGNNIKALLNLNNSDVAGKAAHHIVAGGSKFAKDTRKILAKFNIDINDAVNGVYLDTAKHFGLHTKEYYNKVQALLETCKTKEQVINTLKMIGKELAEGAF